MAEGITRISHFGKGVVFPAGGFPFGSDRNLGEVITGPSLNTLDCLSEKGLTDRFNLLNLAITSF
jgi:hypothetical protein